MTPTPPSPGSPTGVGPADDRELVRVLTAIQARGGIGRGSVTAAIDHARSFVSALPWEVMAGTEPRAGVDLGSGGGLPGLVLAHDRPDLRLTLVERRAKRADLLSYGVRSLVLDDRVDVFCGDVETVMTTNPRTFDLVTARSFAAPQRVLEVASALLASRGWLLVSEPPDDAPRWTEAAVSRLGLVDDGRHGRVRRLHRVD